jgi:hypothetical protein
MATRHEQGGASPLPTIAALFAPTAASYGLMEVRGDDPDAAAINAWNDRQKALAAIERLGRFFDAENVSPKQAELFDAAEMAVIRLPATTVRGALAKLWVALAHIETVHNEEDRLRHDAARRADLAEVEFVAEDFDFPGVCVLSAIRSLTPLAEG